MDFVDFSHPILQGCATLEQAVLGSLALQFELISLEDVLILVAVSVRIRSVQCMDIHPLVLVDNNCLLACLRWKLQTFIIVHLGLQSPAHIDVIFLGLMIRLIF
jgi:uncharacterized membrane protein YjdF